MNKFKLNEVVRITRNLDLTATGGPYIPLGTRGIILRRRRDGKSVWINCYHYGQRELNTADIASGNTPMADVRKTGEHLFADCGGCPKCVTCGCDEDDAFVGGEKCSFRKPKKA